MSSPLVEEIFEVRLPEPELTKFDRERRAFLRLLPDLLQTHRGLYVAIHNEEVVDSGPERLPLVLRVQEKLRTGIYVALVSEEPIPVVRSGIRRTGNDRRPSL